VLLLVCDLEGVCDFDKLMEAEFELVMVRDGVMDIDCDEVGDWLGVTDGDVDMLGVMEGDWESLSGVEVTDGEMVCVSV
jgi:hypothetical protein